MVSFIQRRTPGSFSEGWLGKGLRKLFIPTYRRVTGRRVDQLQAEWLIQGFLTRQWQRRFAVRDHFVKRPYKQIECLTEFGPELKYYLPYAYWHFLNGTLKSTTSFGGTTPFYFFSPQHVEREAQRDYILDPEVPNSEDHNFRYSYKRWAQVPLKKHYTDKLSFGFPKPPLIISNKYNQEWNRPPINFLSLEVLGQLIDKLSSRYTIIYNRPTSRLIVVDHNHLQDLDDKAYLKNTFPQVHLAEDLYSLKQHEVSGFNHFQLCLYATCERFISVQGGNSVLASYFGGKNLIFQRQGQEIFFRELETIYPKLAGTDCYGFSEYSALLAGVDEHYLT